MFKKIVVVFISISLVLTFFYKGPFVINADETPNYCDFDSDEYDSSRCGEYQQERIEDIEEKIKNAKSDMVEQQKLANEFGAKIDAIQLEIDELEPQIEELEETIEILQQSIDENEAKVESLKKRILKRMLSSQGTMHFNPYLEFLLGSNGFTDMLRRSYGVEAITTREETTRNELIDILTKLQSDKQQFDDAKKELDAKKDELESNKHYSEQMRSYYEQVVAETYEIIRELQEEEASHRMVLNSIVYEIDELLAWDRQTGLIHPVSGSTISAGMPYYPSSFGGGVHIGIDYAAGYGTSILAPANGVIIASVNACENDRGYNLGDRCGYVEGKGMAAGGNQLRMIFSVNGIMFGMIAFHMLYGSVHAEGVVRAGTQIGRVGSSGNSTGAHCHIELFYLGKGESEDIPEYLSRGYTVGFNLGYNVDSLCSKKGGSPCRLDGSLHFGEDPVNLEW